MILFISHHAHAQLQIGIGVGGEKNKLSLVNGVARPFTTYNTSFGSAVQLLLKYPLLTSITLGLDPTFINKNYNIVRSGYYANVNESIVNSYIQLPLSFTYFRDCKQLSFGINAGIYLAYWLKSKRSGIVPNLSNLSFQDGGYKNVFDNMLPYSYNERQYLTENKDRRLEYGWLLGVDIQYDLDPKCKIFVAPRYYYSLAGQVKGSYVEQRYNETLAVFSGILFTLPAPKK